MTAFYLLNKSNKKEKEIKTKKNLKAQQINKTQNWVFDSFTAIKFLNSNLKCSNAWGM